MAQNLLRNWRVMLLIGLLVLAMMAISTRGLPLGIDLQGGTLFQIHLTKKATQEEIGEVRDIIQQRLDWTGLKDTSVAAFGDEYILAQIAETNPEQIEKLESMLKKQGRFEVTLDGNLLFTGDDIIRISKDPSFGYGFVQQENAVMWTLPFTLKESAAKRFSTMVFHRCRIVAYAAEAGRQYDCDRTYFFIDRPTESVIVVPKLMYELDSQLMLQGNRLLNIPQGTELEELMLNASVPYFVVDENLSNGQSAELKSLLPLYTTAIVPPTLDSKIKQELSAMGFELKEAAPVSSAYLSTVESGSATLYEAPSAEPWLWQVTGAKQVIMLSEDITNMDPYVGSPSEARIFPDLVIRGFESTPEVASESLKNLTILLESGSLPVPVESISRETISPSLGSEFLYYTFYIVIVALIVVSLVIFARYRRPKLVVPIIFTSLSEVILTVGFASAFNVPRLDLAAMAGLIAAVGTGVDDQIVITDELLQGVAAEAASLLIRIKRAFFIVFAAAAASISTMLPIVIFGFGLGKLVGFALTVILCVLIGVLITRPAYGEIARVLLQETPGKPKQAK